MLGPLVVRAGDRAVPLAGSGQRTLLAVLLAHAGEVVAPDVLAAELAAEPGSGVRDATVEEHVEELSRALGPSVPHPEREAGGYRLTPAGLDAAAFDLHVAAARVALAADRPESAVTELTRALAGWRGPALADVAPTPSVVAYAARLDAARLRARELLTTTRLNLGQQTDLLTELVEWASTASGRESVHRLLLTGLYRHGRRVDALHLYRRLQQALADVRPVPGGTAAG